MSCFTFCFLLSSVCFCFLWLLAIVTIPEYSALSEAIVKLTGEGMGKIVNNPKAIKLRPKPTNLTSKNVRQHHFLS